MAHRQAALRRPGTGAGTVDCRGLGENARIYQVEGNDQSTGFAPERAFDLWYRLGPGCLLLLRHDGPHACEALLVLKGATLPGDASPESIRYAGENGLMNLVHGPDDDAAGAAELSLLLNVEPAMDVRRFTVRPDERIRYVTVDLLPEAVPVDSGPGAISLPLIISRIRVRLVQQLALRGCGRTVPLQLARTAMFLRDEQRRSFQ